MVNKKVTQAMIERWQTEIGRRIFQERKTNVIKDIAEDEGLSYSTVYYWTAPGHHRQKRREYAKNYRQDHLQECREKGRKYGRKYVREHRQEQIAYNRSRYSNPEVRVRVCAQTRLRWKVNNHIDQLLPEIVSAGKEPMPIEEMVDMLRHITSGITVRPSTLERSIKDYLAHNPNPIIREVSPSKYIRI